MCVCVAHESLYTRVSRYRLVTFRLAVARVGQVSLHAVSIVFGAPACKRLDMSREFHEPGL